VEAAEEGHRQEGEVAHYRTAEEGAGGCHTRMKAEAEVVPHRRLLAGDRTRNRS
jgi:hypothetical protein